MKRISFPILSRNTLISGFFLLFLALISSTLQNNRQGIWVFTWITPAILLYFTRQVPFRRKWLWLYIILWISYVMGAIHMAPFPLPILLVIGLAESMKVMVPFIIDRIIYRKSQAFWTSLVFPAVFTLKEYLESFSGGGAWSSIANTQFNFGWLAQLASLSGLWGITFLITWMASAVVWALVQRKASREFGLGIKVYGVVFVLVMIYGIWRSERKGSEGASVPVAGMTVPVFPLMEAVYKDVTGETIKIDPRLSQASPQLQRISQALIPFIENPDPRRFRNGFDQMTRLHDSLFALTDKLAARGARIISWSEANALVFKMDEQALIGRGRTLAASRNIYLLMTLASIDTGNVYPGKKFIENKAIFIGPDGQILNTFFKNKPVPMVENSVPGDGQIPVIKTRYGTIAVSICYDADFPAHMRQLGTKKADLLLLPSGDWYSISPFHSRMAIFRSIENGTAIFRQVSGGLSVASDARGKMNGNLDFFKAAEKAWITEIRFESETTLYNLAGDWLIGFCGLVLTWTLIFLGNCYFRLRKGRKQLAMGSL